MRRDRTRQFRRPNRVAERLPRSFAEALPLSVAAVVAVVTALATLHLTEQVVSYNHKVTGKNRQRRQTGLNRYEGD
ncbi:hypothetical protein GCM10010517_18520 [Streptosporangium fragile]|uniref:Uncharacterized protein n=1 Tax=Streptosporangium fragile TaxID=46186 RepID=A0ABP6IBP0_9ACTN